MTLSYVEKQPENVFTSLKRFFCELYVNFHCYYFIMGRVRDGSSHSMGSVVL